MRSCPDLTCSQWPLLASDQFCSWCGRRLVEVEAGFEAKQGDQWVRLAPAVLNRERPPSLRLRVAHSGEAGHLKLAASDFRLSGTWLDLDFTSLSEQALKPGEAVHCPVRKLKVPGPEELAHEIRVELVQSEVRASASLTFVPSPELHLEMSSQEVVLSSESEPLVEASLVLRQGRIALQAPPRLDPPWASLELLQPSPEDEGWEMDAQARPRLSFRLRFAAEELAVLRQRSADRTQGESLPRQAALVFDYWDRGQATPQPLAAQLPLQLNFVLAPELYLEPFGHESRREWQAVVGLQHQPRFQLVVHNGPPGSPPRQDLVLQYLKVRDLDGGEDFPCECSQAPPWRISAGRPLALQLGLPPHLRASSEGAQRRLQLIPVSNDPIQRLFHLRLSAQPAQVFPGYLVIDLGTTATCAALVGESKLVKRVNLEGQAEMPSATCYLRWVQERKWEVGQRALLRRLEPAAQRSVVVQAKRRVGDESQPYEVVPLDEPAETLVLTPSQALSHLYREVIDQALQQLLEQDAPQGLGSNGKVLLERLLITHPSRFSLRQVESLKQAAYAALTEHWRHWTRQERTDLPLPLTLHEPTAAAFHFLRDWRNLEQVHSQLGPQAHWHLLVYDLGGGTLDSTLMAVESSQKELSYQVTPRVIGATGERHFGGQDCTLALLQLLQASLDQHLDSWRWPDPQQGLSQKMNSLRNHHLLLHWCEAYKLALVADQLDRAWDTFPSLTLYEQGRERLVTVSHWRQRLSLPSLSELEAAIQPQLQGSLDKICQLVERHGVERPEVVLRVGQASQLPCVAAGLQARFPEALHLAPEILKGCVVEGACVPPLPGLSSGVQLARSSRRAGVSFRWQANQSYSATTCRLGIQVVDSGETWFQEVLPEGVPIPPQGLQGCLDGLYLEAGHTTFILLENAGHQDALWLQGHPNPDIQPLARCSLEVPPLANQEEFRLTFELQLQGNLKVSLAAPDWEGVSLVELDSSQLGRQY